VLGFGGGEQPTTKPGIDYFNLGGGFPADTTPPQVAATYRAARNGVDYAGPFIYPHPLVSGRRTEPDEKTYQPASSPASTPRLRQHFKNNGKIGWGTKKRKKGKVGENSDKPAEPLASPP
jgi:hypothetical protein